MSVLKYKDALGNWIKILTIKGDKGETGAQGAQGIPGVSPTVTVSDIPGGHRVTITDADHPGGISFDVMDGSDADAPVQDVTVEGTSVVNEQGVAAIPRAILPASGDNPGNFGLVSLRPGRGIAQNSTNGSLYIAYAGAGAIKSGNGSFDPITTSYQHNAVFFGLSKLAGVDLRYETVTVGQYPEASKSAIHEMLSGSITVTGTTPTINALPGLRYTCGEVSTLTVNLPASGCVDIQFESGSTPTVLTVNAASGQTVTFPVWFDDENLEADTVYEMSFADGYGAVMSWAT